MNQSKISVPEAIFLIIGAIFVDVLDFIPFVDVIASICSIMIFQIYFLLRGIRGTYSLVGNIIDLVPFIGLLPATTAGVVVTIIIDRNEKLKTTLEGKAPTMPRQTRAYDTD